MVDPTRKLEVGYYRPTPAFAAVREHICVMDTSPEARARVAAQNPGADPTGSGELVAIFGASVGAAGAVAESRQLARLFVAAYETVHAPHAPIYYRCDHGILHDGTAWCNGCEALTARIIEIGREALAEHISAMKDEEGKANA